MELFDETLAPLKKLWVDGKSRQDAKIVLAHTIGQATELSMKETQDIMDQLDVVLLKAEEEQAQRIDPGL